MKIFFIIFSILFFSDLPSKGQNLFIIGEKSYPSTKAMRLESNSDDRDYDGSDDLDVFVAKDGARGLFGVSTKSIYRSEFSGKLNIYLEDGSVLTCNESVASEEVDDHALALYDLTDDQLNQLKTSNIHTVKYTILLLLSEEKYSASNKGLETHEIISEFLNPKAKFNGTDNTAINTPTPQLIEEPKEEEPFAYVEQMPTFPDGTQAMYKYINEMMMYPANAKENGISGLVIVQFVVSKEGDIQKAKVVRGIGGGCNEEALRIVNSMPRWNPGKHNGRFVPVTYTLPIKFVLP